MNWTENYLQFKSSHAFESLKANQLRQDSFTRFEKEGLPTKKEEAWKFTSLKPFSEITWTALTGEEGLTHEQMLEISKHLPSEFINFVFVNGKLNPTLSDDTEDFFKIAEASEEDFTADQKAVEARLLNLAQAFLNKKVVLNVEKNKIIERPVQILFVNSLKNVYISERLQVRLDERAQLKLIINSLSLSGSGAGALNVNLTLTCGPQSNLTLIQLQNENSESFHFSQTVLEAQTDSIVSSLVLSLGSKLVRNYYQLKFTGRHAQADVLGLAVGDQSQHFDNYTFLQHMIGENQSVQQYKSILAGTSQSVFRGRVLIEKDAQKANSSQLNNNLLLTRGAQADSIPQLEIYADDVKAGHGSTVGQLNKEEIFYFLSRGINQYEAVKMLSYGFANELIYKISSPALQNFLLQALSEKLSRLVQNV
jgi:Fe-S cluster assembly protein SufD